MVKYIKDTTQFEKMVLIDYGFARESPTKTLLGTLGYIDPDYIKKKFLSVKSDIYSLGITLFASMFGILGPFDTEIDPESESKSKTYEELTQIRKVCPRLSQRSRKWSSIVLSRKFTKYPILIYLIYNMLMCPMENRYNIEQVIEHKWFNIID